ncbi:MAG: NAD(P)/FAD-dependent oxidoreductase [Thermomicrobia bacterium]|nr:NAD(P)/FAD-dependent oxidoreductase [Thermomicrobia bacterium]
MGGGPRVVILGAGFGGLTAARTLAQRLAPGQAAITLVDRNNYHLFTPLLYQIAACGVDPWDTAQPVREIVRGYDITFRQSAVQSVDLAARTVQLDDGALPYDYLIVALGSTTNFFHEASAERHALPIKTIPQALAIRDRVIGAFERAATLPEGDARRTLLTFVVVGGGATGTELTASLADLLYRVLPPQYPQIDFAAVRLVMIESEDRPIANMAHKLGDAALDRLHAQGVEGILNTKASEIGADYVKTDTGETIKTATPIWATGVRANAIAANLPGVHSKGGTLAVDDYLRLTDHPEVFAVGDNAAYTPPGTHDLAPMLAWVANQQGKAAAENIAAAIIGAAPAPFHLRPLGSAVSLGRNDGAAQFGPIAVDGFFGWLAWRAIHLAKISAFRGKLGVALDWTYAYFYHRDTARLIPARDLRS